MKIEFALSVIFQNGKYKGKIVDSVPSSYLKWVAENFKDDALATAADTVWQWREQTNCHF